MEKIKAIGLGIMIVAVVLFFIGYSYISSAEQALLAGHTLEEGVCVHEEGALCPYERLSSLAMPKYVGLFADIALFIFGLVLFLTRKPEEKSLKKAKEAAKKLGGEEGKVFELIVQSDGMIFQNDLVSKTEYSKVKVTRILDRLEAKGLIERRRRGMTNVVMLK